MSTSKTTSSTNHNTSSNKENIANAVIEKVKSLLNVNLSVQVNDDFKSALYDFIMKKEFNGGINVFLSKEPITDDVKTFSANDTHDVTVSFGKNNRKEMHPYLLSVTVSKKTITVFKNFWERRACPPTLFDDAVAKLNLMLPVSIMVFKSPHVWNEFKKKCERCEFIGQTPDQKTGSFVPTIPIGYVDRKTNSVVMTNPSLSRASLCYTFDLKNR